MISLGQQYQSRAGLVVTVIGVRQVARGRRNILVGYTNAVTERSESTLLSETELCRRYPFLIGTLQSIAFLSSSKDNH
jgi:hypothetical protein